MRLYRITIFFFLLAPNLYPQLKKPDLFVETSAFISSGKNAPFWLLSNQYGKYSNHWYNITYSAGAKAVFDTAKKIDYGYGVEIMNRIDDRYTLYPQELYLAGKLWFFDLHAGWRKEIFGNAYPGLTSGNLLWSGNARPMPKLSINIPKFVPVPYTKGYLEFKGNFAHGWFEKERYVKGVMMHHKSMIAQAGGSLPVNIHFGLHHFAQWGGVSPDPRFGDMPSDLRTFWWVVQAKDGAPVDSLGGESTNRYGNHLGSYNLGFDIKTKNWKTGFYLQSIFEDNSGRHWRNYKDGLWGIYWENKKENTFIKTIVVEYLNTTDQSGPSHNRIDSLGIIPGGNDDYFNNYVWQNGWTYHHMMFGTPLVTSQEILSTGSVGLANNKVKAIHFSMSGQLFKFGHYKFITNYNYNYGRNRVPYNHIQPNTYASVKNDMSMYLEYSHYFQPENTYVSISASMDFGNHLGNNVGLMCTCKKVFNH